MPKTCGFFSQLRVDFAEKLPPHSPSLSNLPDSRDLESSWCSSVVENVELERDLCLLLLQVPVSAPVSGGHCVSQGAGLDEIPDIPMSDTELLRDKLDFVEMVQDSVPPAVTPQVLTLLPDKGLDYDETLVSKSTLEDSSVLDGFDIPADELASELASLDQEGGIEKSVGSVNLDLLRNTGAKDSAISTIPPIGDQGDPNSIPGLPTKAAPLATISISTDRATNTTKILIDTGRGQQLFQINTADLEQATSTLEPKALQGGMVGFDRNGQVLNTGTVSGITVQDGEYSLRAPCDTRPGSLYGLSVQNRTPFFMGNFLKTEKFATIHTSKESLQKPRAFCCIIFSSKILKEQKGCAQTDGYRLL